MANAPVILMATLGADLEISPQLPNRSGNG
jgi:hypothetical protein